MSLDEIAFLTSGKARCTFAGADTTCNPNATNQLCNGPLPSGRSFQVAFRGRTGSANDPSKLTNFSSPISTEGIVVNKNF